MILKVISYSREDDAYKCIDEKGETHQRVDFHISGSPLIKKYQDRETLIGKTVEVEWLQPFLELSGQIFSIEDTEDITARKLIIPAFIPKPFPESVSNSDAERCEDR